MLYPTFFRRLGITKYNFKQREMYLKFSIRIYLFYFLITVLNIFYIIEFRYPNICADDKGHIFVTQVLMGNNEMGNNYKNFLLVLVD